MRGGVGGGRGSATKNGTGRLSWPSVLGEQTTHTRSAEWVRSLGLDLVVVVVGGGGVVVVAVVVVVVAVAVAVVVVVVVVQCEYIGARI